MATQLSASEREFLAVQREAGRPIAWLAKTIGRAESTLRRELKRNSTGRHYLAHEAQLNADRRRVAARQKSRKMQRPEVREFVIEHLRLHWSPEQIAGDLKRRFPQDRRFHLTAQTIYTWARGDDHRRVWRKLLRRAMTRKRHRESIGKERCAIADRPAIIEQRGRYGDWEGDTIVGPKHQGGALISLVERRCGWLELIYVENLKTKTVTRAIFRRLLKYPPHFRQSITFDNGSEFADHQWLKKHLLTEIYFAALHSPWQRGTNENTNGLVREFFPKGTRFDEISAYQIEKTQELLNQRPRKRLGFQTPAICAKSSAVVQFKLDCAGRFLSE
ncbi:IS30 family transposase [Anatilimnocola floriformis]|uniref:IS30 family transposase n=1 Tax=Anatilimnocola floriformis TaxID=2948575 RepID=UPI0020C2B37A|nr:IS30 family transposase [Anatilimnocola floriformis]